MGSPAPPVGVQPGTIAEEAVPKQSNEDSLAVSAGPAGSSSLQDAGQVGTGDGQAKGLPGAAQAQLTEPPAGKISDRTESRSLRLAPGTPPQTAQPASGGKETDLGDETVQVPGRASAGSELPAAVLPAGQRQSSSPTQGVTAAPMLPGNSPQHGPGTLANADGIPTNSPSTAPDLAAKPAAASLQSAEPALARPAHEAARADRVQQKASSVTGQPVLTAADGSSLVRDPAGSAQGEPAGTGARSAAAAMREPFAALDAGTTAGTPTWIHASAQQAEAGFQDPALGWVGVRAEASGGSVHAALVPGSAAAAQTLAGHLAGLNAYLASEHAPVAAVTLAASGERTGAYSMDQGTNQNFNQGAGQNAAGQQFTPSASPVPAPAVFRAAAARAEAPEIANSSGGAHISVIA